MALIRGGRCGPDPSQGDGKYRNEVETDRAAWWMALGGRSGILRGFVHSQVAGQMQLSFTAGAALVSERDASGNEQLRGYMVWADAATVVQFGVASASARNDAVVAAFVDTEDGAVGTGALATGGHLVVIPGVSGTATPRTDAQVTAYLGRGGWVRLMDVPIASTDTQINTANIVTASQDVAFYDSGAITNAFTVATGWTLTSQTLRRVGRFIYFDVQVTRTGANITSTNGNIANTAVATWSTARYPILMDASCSNNGISYMVAGLAQSGTIYVCSVANDVFDIATGEGIQLAGHWVSA